jgi:XTP/dITP diphosphohydrolase
MKIEGNRIVVATRNAGKIKEFAHAFQRLGKEIRSMYDYGGLPEIEETGATFAENAFIKAKAVAEALQVPVLADDSGLCVDALDGAPGVYSARYSGEEATDAANNRKLIAELARAGAKPSGPDGTLSTARFVCALVLYDPQTGNSVQAEGAVEGRILPEPRGQGGFGYDPLFYLPDLGKTMAELSLEEKGRISHRARALAELIRLLG